MTGRGRDGGQVKGAARGRAKRLRALAPMRPAAIVTGRMRAVACPDTDDCDQGGSQ
jgi:hypothetical protein